MYIRILYGRRTKSIVLILIVLNISVVHTVFLFAIKYWHPARWRGPNAMVKWLFKHKVDRYIPELVYLLYTPKLPCLLFMVLLKWKSIVWFIRLFLTVHSSFTISILPHHEHMICRNVLKINVRFRFKVIVLCIHHRVSIFLGSSLHRASISPIF